MSGSFSFWVLSDYIVTVDDNVGLGFKDPWCVWTVWTELKWLEQTFDRLAWSLSSRANDDEQQMRRLRWHDGWAAWQWYDTVK